MAGIICQTLSITLTSESGLKTLATETLLGLTVTGSFGFYEIDINDLPVYDMTSNYCVYG